MAREKDYVDSSGILEDDIFAVADRKGVAARVVWDMWARGASPQRIALKTERPVKTIYEILKQIEELIIGEGHSENKPDSQLGGVVFQEAEPKNTKVTIGQEVENSLAQAWIDRELVSALMETEGMGLKILMVLLSEMPMSASNLAAAINVQRDSTTPLLDRLILFGAVSEDKNLFSLTERGIVVIQNLETAIDNSHSN